MEIILTKIENIMRDNIFKNVLNLKANEKLQIKIKAFSSLVTDNFKIYLNRFNWQQRIQIKLFHKLTCKKHPQYMCFQYSTRLFN